MVCNSGLQHDLLWTIPPLFYTYTRHCILVQDLAKLLGVPAKTAKSVMWALARRGLVERAECGYTITCRKMLDWIEVVARSSNKFVAYGNGVIVLSYIRSRGIRAYQIPINLACRVQAELENAGLDAAQCWHMKNCIRMIAEKLGVHAKTVSLALRSLALLSCPSTICPITCSEYQGN
ncbi:hypothetical protein [Hyperthermus butylicus]|uniref:Uncharacterized protein n=1 Tax=Hyperthermus butylicus (strain DSM 5456 / JCM 9403 / PLM1-5) TaxID=415426 RepID=A2BLV7_HYPBU|nr:hypothetical protein [Hyperthermus butylicus]ABM80968.1 hypothetical protein Hbut_1130 [Hyperthermus butylicus DSM 5456]